MLNNLFVEMVRRNVSEKNVSALLNLSERQVMNRLYGESEFTVSQALKIFNVYFFDCDFKILFKDEDDLVLFGKV